MYAVDEQKTERRYVTGVNCTWQTALDEMESVKAQYDKFDKRSYYHFKQSFHPDENVSPDEVHRIGMELAKELWPDYQVVVATHLDKAHLHNHFIINSVGLSGKKLHYNDYEFKQYRNINDRICKAHGLSVITDKRYRGKTYKDWLEGKNGSSNIRDLIKVDIDMCIKNSFTMNDFYTELYSLGYEVKRGKHTGVSPPGHYRKNGNRSFFRLYKLNDPKYTIEGIEERVRENYRMNFGRKPVYRKKVYRIKVPFILRHNRIGYYRAIYYRYLYTKGVNKKRPVKSPAAVKQDIIKLQDLNRHIKYIAEHGIKTKESLDKRYEEIQTEIFRKELQRDSLRYELSQKDNDHEEIRNAIHSITEEISKSREELRIMDGIKVKSGKILMVYKDIREGRVKAKKQIDKMRKGGEKDATRGTSGRDVSERSRFGANPSR